RLFPDIDFKVLSLFDTGLEDRSCDLVMIHDLFEHLSPEGMERALKETIRVCERQIWIHFFNLSDIPEHHFKKTENYHWNQLSLDRILEFLKPYSSDIEVICIPEMLKNKFGFDDYHNQQAVTLIVSMD
ncbi:MAG TPA: class I SAM-dependent methyltransferase, partial [Verrucomicrobia bacterium]|nr:class I SAM-dependent methyltransferase [Verrucomicrobiota bacterium]